MPTDKKPILHRNVVMTGLTSFFTDISSEMIYPLLQGFIATVMRTQGALIGPVLGIIEGIAESTASLLKVASGYWSDRIRARKMPAILGYAVSAVSKALYFFPVWYAVLSARFFDRAGKGIRNAPRDALISDAVPATERGRAFGFQRGMDFAGAFLGTVVLFLIVSFVFPDFNTKAKKDPTAFMPIFVIALIPALLGVIFLFFTKEEKDPEAAANGKEKPKPNLDIRMYDKTLRWFFLAQFLFTLGNSSNQFLLLRSMDLGMAFSVVLLMYIAFNLTSSLLSPLFGTLSDKIGRRRLLIWGYMLYGFVYAAFGFLSKGNSWLLWAIWPVYGVYYAMTEGVEKAYVADLAPKDSRATALGFYYTITGIGLLPASIIAGFFYSILANHSLPYLFGSGMAVVTVILLVFFVKEQPKTAPNV
jgi:MFS family permease